MRKKCHYICFRNGTQNDEILLMKTRKTLTKNNKETCAKLFHKSNIEYFNNMYVSKVSDSRRFSKTIKPRFSSKWKTENTIILTLGDTILQNEKLKVNTLFC